MEAAILGFRFRLKVEGIEKETEITVLLGVF